MSVHLTRQKLGTLDSESSKESESNGGIEDATTPNYGSEDSGNKKH